LAIRKLARIIAIMPNWEASDITRQSERIPKPPTANKASDPHGSSLALAIRRNRAAKLNTGGTTKHQTPMRAYRSAAAAQPAANTAMFVDIPSNRAAGRPSLSVFGA